jgi:aerobic carbon-monoxide dehydrogenase medium subunit
VIDDVTSTGVSECVLQRASTAEEAVTAIHRQGAVPIAGGTWVMRTSVRGEQWADAYVPLAGIAELRDVEIDAEARFGACVTHAELASATAREPWLRALHLAAGRSANPAVRRVATIGGNLCTAGFAAADLVPALLCLDAEVMLSDADGQRALPLTTFLQTRDTLISRAIVRGVLVRRRNVVSGHARLPMRAAGGDYPVAIVSAAVAVDPEGTIEHAAVAVGSVEPVARRWPELEASLLGRPVDPQYAAQAAEGLPDGWTGREDVDAPGWYRVRVLPGLVRRALGEIVAAQEGPSWQSR